jgi:protease I
MSLTDTPVLVLAADLFEDSELLYPVLRLKEEHADVTVASVDGESVTGKKGHGPFPVDTSVEGLTADDFAGIVIPGGFAPDALRRSEKVLELVRAFDAADKPVAFICHAGWVPISAGIIDGRRATSFAAIKDDMVNAGCDWQDEEVVVDGNLISSRHPGDLGPWLRAIIEALGGRVN